MHVVHSGNQDAKVGELRFVGQPRRQIKKRGGGSIVAGPKLNVHTQAPMAD